MQKFTVKEAKFVVSNRDRFSKDQVIQALDVLLDSKQQELTNKDRQISRLNLEAQRWFDFVMDNELMNPNINNNSLEKSNLEGEENEKA